MLIEGAFKELVPTYLSPSDFWDLSLSELSPVVQNIKIKMWEDRYNELMYNRVLAADISKVLAGKQFDSILNYLPPNPRTSHIRSVEDIEKTLLGWAYNGEYSE